MNVKRLRPLIPLAAGVAGFLYFVNGRDYPFKWALLMGAALMVLGIAALRTWERMRAGSVAQLAPGEGDQRAGERQVDRPSERPADQETDEPGRDQAGREKRPRQGRHRDHE